MLTYLTSYLHKPMEKILKLVPTIFYHSQNDSPSITTKNLFYFIEKALFILKIFKFS